MKWKSNVIVKRGQEWGYILIRDGMEISVERKYDYLIMAMESGIEKDEVLTKLIMKNERLDEGAAGFTLASFIIKYGECLAEDEEHYRIQY